MDANELFARSTEDLKEAELNFHYANLVLEEAVENGASQYIIDGILRDIADFEFDIVVAKRGVKSAMVDLGDCGFRLV